MIGVKPPAFRLDDVADHDHSEKQVVTKKAKKEWVPWYRERNYKGNLTEAEKRELDSFRTQPKHPAADPDQLPQEVRDYINDLEFELYDRKQEMLFYGCSLIFAIGLYVVAEYFFVILNDDKDLIQLIIGVSFIIVALMKYKRDRRKNADEFMPSGEDGYFPTDEGIKRCWEISYLVKRDKERKDET